MLREIQSGETYSVTEYQLRGCTMIHQRLWDAEGRLVLDLRFRADEPPEDDCMN